MKGRSALDGCRVMQVKGVKGVPSLHPQGGKKGTEKKSCL